MFSSVLICASVLKGGCCTAVAAQPRLTMLNGGTVTVGRLTRAVLAASMAITSSLLGMPVGTNESMISGLAWKSDQAGESWSLMGICSRGWVAGPSITSPV
jgi:hypothetical protein